ncbi:DUF3311 domain-containing protein [Cytobacillus kochii]|uniref:DUF3311 domain-containing protein n=1 Tax=Cytobacillus kochii TaxID=859143 RepID=UPI0025A013E7|nr:DUF3311 domain-containing protein [Cytobacillus kochii]MDM5209345.1 DUF3311 domain-containing protein [Cytobacillus kochii]
MKKRKFISLYVVVTMIPFLLLIFPLFELVNRPTPIILGLPFSFFWVILWIFITFVALIVLYFIDPDKNEEGGF